jgi:hypothetical protein
MGCQQSTTTATSVRIAFLGFRGFLGCSMRKSTALA